jgi:hypothetical protein
MAQGAARADRGSYILFADADIALSPGLVAALVRAAEAGGFDLVSQMALLHVAAFWERALIPAFGCYPVSRCSTRP